VRDAAAELHLDSGCSAEASMQIESRAGQLPIEAKEREEDLWTKIMKQ